MMVLSTPAFTIGALFGVVVPLGISTVLLHAGIVTELLYIYNKIVAIMKQTLRKTEPFDTKKSIQNAYNRKLLVKKWTLSSDGKVYVWTNKMERVGIIRQGIPYDSIEVISRRLNRPVKSILSIVEYI